MVVTKLLRRVIWLVGIASTSCNSSFSPDRLLPASILYPQETSLVQVQAPWHLSAQVLSESELSRLGNESPRVTTTTTTHPTTTVAVKLRLQGQDPKLPIAELLQEQAPGYSPDQVQNVLFYHMAEAGYLHLAGSKVRPVTAYVEMTTQRDQCLDLVFIFSLDQPALRQASTARFILDKAFFLSQPVEFALPATRLLPAS